MRPLARLRLEVEVVDLAAPVPLRVDELEKTLQNWQSEFLAVGTMAVLAYLRQRGSPESKPVGAPHDQTGSTG